MVLWLTITLLGYNITLTDTSHPPSSRRATMRNFKEIQDRVVDFYQYVEYALMGTAAYCYVYSIAQITTAGIV